MESLLATPLGDAAEQATLDVAIAGQTFRVQAGRQQVLNLLVSTFENAVAKNQELIAANEDLSLARDKLQQTNAELSDLNDKISTINARMIRDLEAAAKVQRSLLPADEAALPAATVAWRYVPCQSLAGDFLDFFPLDTEHAGLFVVDVSGHGRAVFADGGDGGAIPVAEGRPTSRSWCRQQSDGSVAVARPAEVATQLNRLFQADEFSGLYFTILYGVLHLPTGRLDYVSAGHPALLHVPAGGVPAYHGADGLADRLRCPDTTYDQQSLQLAAGDRVYLYSDGVTEAMDAGHNTLGEAALVDRIAAARGRPLDETVAGLWTPSNAGASLPDRWMTFRSSASNGGPDAAAGRQRGFGR